MCALERVEATAETGAVDGYNSAFPVVWVLCVEAAGADALCCVAVSVCKCADGYFCTRTGRVDVVVSVLMCLDSRGCIDASATLEASHHSGGFCVS